MWKCPVCDHSNDTPFCPICGFDRSLDPQAHPALSPFPGDRKAPSRLRQERQNLLICPDCGGTAFACDLSAGLLHCRICGYTHKISAADPGRRTVTAISAGAAHTAVLYSDGTVENIPVPHKKRRRITAIAAGDAHTAVLYDDGTVRAVGKNNMGQCNTGTWRDITAICAGYESTIGLRRDGTVVSAGNNYENKAIVHPLRNVSALCNFTGGHILFLHPDGTLTTLGDNADGQRATNGWNQLIAASAGTGFTLGLFPNGTVKAIGYNEDGRCNTQNWKNITAVATGNWHSLGLKKDGTAVAAGGNGNKQCDVQGWKNLVQLVGGKSFSAGLHANGTVSIASSLNVFPQAEAWTDIISLAAGDEHLIGLRRDGALLCAGWNKEGQCNTDDLWDL